jgi:hypothetical protein
MHLQQPLGLYRPPPQDSTVRVKGFNGTASSAEVGMRVWNTPDDCSQRHALKIKNTFHVPACPLGLLSPQHCSQQENDAGGWHLLNELFAITSS